MAAAASKWLTTVHQGLMLPNLCGERSRRVPKLQKRPADVFLNIPYDQDFQDLYLAYIAGVSAFGLAPRATLEIPGGAPRLNKILALIQQCEYSIHDLSRVELDGKRPQTPRFNMPFELGLSVAWQRMRRKEHTWSVFETKRYRLAKSLSDLNGTDPYIHNGKVAGVFQAFGNAFVRPGSQPSVGQMKQILQQIKKNLPTILKDSGARSVYEARVFKEICVVASAAADKILKAS
jgi:hypothetical protein